LPPGATAIFWWPGVNSKGSSNCAPLDPALSEGKPTVTFPSLPKVASRSPGKPADAAPGDTGSAAVATPTIAAALTQITTTTDTVALQALIIVYSLSGMTVGPSWPPLNVQPHTLDLVSVCGRTKGAVSHNPPMARETQTIEVHALGTVTFRPLGKVQMERLMEAAKRSSVSPLADRNHKASTHEIEDAMLVTQHMLTPKFDSERELLAALQGHDHVIGDIAHAIRDASWPNRPSN